ncbi:MAG: SpoIIE family protein phosphatase [Candidatus Riflebacteria bacterium]|nr:SpoIIE family protein phosphatase [Candidatus Riflebacteria bacterium]
MVETVFLDSSGIPVPELTDIKIPSSLIQKFFFAYKEVLEFGNPLPSTIKSFLKTFFGSYLPIDMSFFSRFLMGFGAPTPKYLYISRPYKQGMFIIIFKPTKHPRDIALKMTVLEVKKRYPDFEFTLAYQQQKSRNILRRLNAPGELDVSFWKKIQKTPLGFCWFNNTFLGRRILFPSVWVVGSKTIPAAKRFFHSPEFSSFLAQFLFFGILILIFFESKWGQIFFSSVRWKLFSVFLYSSLIPLLIMSFSLQSFIRERRGILEKEMHEKIEKALISFDSGFKTYLGNLRWELQEAFLEQNNGRGFGEKELFLQAENLKKLWNFDLCWIVDSKGKVVFESSNDYPKINLGTLGKIFKESAKNAISISNSRIESFSFINSKQNPSVEKKSENFAPVHCDFNPDLNKINLGDELFYFGTTPIQTGQNKISHYAVFFWNPINIQWNYVKTRFPEFLRKLASPRGLAWSTDEPQTVFPSEFQKDSKYFDRFVQSKSRAFLNAGSFHGNRTLYTGLRGENVDRISFLIFSSDTEISSEINEWIWKFKFLVLATIGLCVIVGLSLSRLFLEPIKNLTNGMKAMIAKDFSFQTPIIHEDELGKLGILFNEAIIELADMEIAKSVQENLFPTAPLVINDWEIFGTCIPARNVGGDYFDYFQISPSQAICIMGDVSGHGIGAALAVSMVKGIIDHPLTKNDPTEILVRLNELFLVVLKKRKMMTCFVALIDFQQNSMVFATSGHPYPVLIENGKASFIEERGTPLGTLKKWKTQNKTISFSKGSMILLYSDGFVEAQDRYGQPFGYERLLSELSSFRRDLAQETEKQIRSWHKGISSKFPPDDDISLLIIQGR